MKFPLLPTLLVLLFSSILPRGITNDYRLLIGTIQLPQGFYGSIPPIRIYCDGKITSCSIDQKNKNISYSIPRIATKYNFKVLIIEPQSIEWVKYHSKYLEDTNIISYRKLKEGHSYKLYALTLVPEITTGNNRQVIYSWRVSQDTIHQETHRIPDDAIIVYADPSYVEGIDASKNFQFPTIHMKQLIVDTVQSQEQFIHKANEIWLATIDTDTLHDPHNQPVIKQVDNRILIAAPTTAA